MALAESASISSISPIESWTVSEVSNFLASIDLDQDDDAFGENEITGDILVRLEHESLKDIGVESVGHRLQILRAVYDFKVKEAVPMEPGDWEPATLDGDGDAGVSTNAELSKDMAIITQAIQQRDDRISSLEEELKKVADSYARLREQLTPVFKIVKEFQPLPTPDGANGNGSAASGQQQQPSLIITKANMSRRYSTKKLFLNGTPRQGSPTSATPGPYSYTSYDPDSPRSPDRQGSQPQHTNSSIPQQQSNVLDSVYTTSAGNRGPPPVRPPPPSQSPFGISSAPPLVTRSLSSNNVLTQESGPAAMYSSANLPPPPLTAQPYLGSHSPILHQSNSPLMASSGSAMAGGRTGSVSNLAATSTMMTPSSSTSSATVVPTATTITNGNNSSSSTTSTTTATNTTSGGGSSGGSSGNPAIDAFKSFRVGLDDPCSKVLPAALKKYRINADWHDYALYICHGDQERCLRLDEKPLLVFQDLQRVGKNPVFMLRKVDNSSSTAATAGQGGGAGTGNRASVLLPGTPASTSSSLFSHSALPTGVSPGSSTAGGGVAAIRLGSGTTTTNNNNSGGSASGGGFTSFANATNAAIAAVASGQPHAGLANTTGVGALGGGGGGAVAGGGGGGGGTAGSGFMMMGSSPKPSVATTTSSTVI